MGRDLLCVFDDVKIIEHLNPDLSKVHALNGLLLHVTAKGAETDCVSPVSYTHLETYTWSVLPDHMKIPLAAQIARELHYIETCLLYTSRCV